MTDAPRPPSEPFFVAHVAPDAPPEVLEALAAVAAAAVRHLQAMPPRTVQLTDRGKHHRQIAGTLLTYCGRRIGGAFHRYPVIPDLLCHACEKSVNAADGGWAKDIPAMLAAV